MQANSTRRHFGLHAAGLAGGVMLLFVALGSSSSAGQTANDRADSDQFAAAASYLHGIIAAMRPDLADRAQSDTHQVQPAPLLKYSDPARGYLAAGLWRLGKAGRPKGFVSAEYWAPNTDNAIDQPYISFEFIPLSDQPFELAGPRAELRWKTDGSGIRPLILPDAPTPATNARQRLTQMRSIARRLDVKQIYRGNANSLRLMAQPVDRYEDREHGIIDGAAFLFAHGTNPEILVLLECDKERWQLGILRMSWAEAFVVLDGREIARFAEIREHPTSGPYQTTGYALSQPLDTKAP